MTREPKPLLIAVLLASCAAPAVAAPTGSAFTYQGRLLENGTPPTGSYDLEFNLYDVPAGGAPVLPSVLVDDVAVAGGLFTVSLDFGAGAFRGEARFMEIGVRPGASGGTFTLLSGRQELRPTPNALATPWTGVHDKPAGFADDVDDDALGVLLCAPGEVAKWTSGAWACGSDADSGGDITDVTAGAGLTGGGPSGAVSLQANFGGSGAATTLSRSDHDHFAQGWTGSAGNGLLVQNSSPANGASALRGNATAGSGATYGVYGSSGSTSGTGVYGTAPGGGVQGIATATSGLAFGVLGSSSSSQGAGVQGYAGAATGSAAGVLGTTVSTSGSGVYGLAQASSGSPFGVFGQAFAPSGTGTYGFHQASSGFGSGVFGQSLSSNGYGVSGWASASIGSGVGVFGSSASPQGRAVYGEATNTASGGFGVYGTTTSTQGRGISGVATATSGTSYGAHGQVDSTGGRGVFGNATATEGNTYGVYGTSASTIGRAVYGTSTATTGVSWGVQGVSASTIGRGVSGSVTATTGPVVGVQGFINSDDGSAISGFANAIVGQADGVVGTTNAPQGVGVYGAAPGSGTNYGTFGFAQSSTGYGVYGWNQSLTGATYGVYGIVYSTGGSGLYGFATATSGLNYGVYGRTQSAAGYAGYFQGRVHVNGTLSKSAGSFKIDHPLDPENKYLYHSFVESPDMKNVYDGVVTTDATGYATVTLPEWFEALNRDFRYQLTVIDDGDAFVLAKVAREIADNRFLVRTSMGGTKVSWQVTGIRKDPYAEHHRIPVEEDKPEEERGQYLQPGDYGSPPSAGWL